MSKLRAVSSSGGAGDGSQYDGGFDIIDNKGVKYVKCVKKIIERIRLLYNILKMNE